MVERFSVFPPSTVLPKLYSDIESILKLASQMSYASSRNYSQKYERYHPDIVQAYTAVYSLRSRRIHLDEPKFYHQEVANKHEPGLKVYIDTNDRQALPGKIFEIKDVGHLAILYDLMPGVGVAWIREQYPLLMNHDLDWMFDDGGLSFCVASKHSKQEFLPGEQKYVLPPENLVINF